MLKRLLNKTPVEEKKKKEHKFALFFIRTFAYLFLVVLILNGLIDFIEGSFYKRYTHYVHVLETKENPSLGDFLFDLSYSPYTQTGSNVKDPQIQFEIPETLTNLLKIHPTLKTYGDSFNPYYIGTDGYKCYLLDRNDINNRSCFEELKKHEYIENESTDEGIILLE